MVDVPMASLLLSRFELLDFKRKLANDGIRPKVRQLRCEKVQIGEESLLMNILLAIAV